MLLRKSLHSTLAKQDAETIVKALYLLNDRPRYGPHDYRLQFDSLSVAADLTLLLKRAGYDWQQLVYDLPRE